MSNTVYEAMKSAFPELENISLPEEPDQFEQFKAWLNQIHCNLMRLDPEDVQLNGIRQCHRLQQLQIDTDELGSQIDAEMAAFHEMYETPDQDEPAEDNVLHAYDFEFTYNVILNNLKLFAAPYDLAVLVIEHEDIYWMLVPDRDELIDKIIHAYTQQFGDEQAISRLS